MVYNYLLLNRIRSLGEKIIRIKSELFSGNSIHNFSEPKYASKIEAALLFESWGSTIVWKYLQSIRFQT